LMYPQTLYDLVDSEGDKGKITYLTLLLSLLLASGGIFYWWYNIQKFPYKRLNLLHFFIEISIYTVGLFSIWLVVWAFYFGFYFKRGYLLEKNKIEDKEWILSRNFSDFGYMPHVKEDKLSNLNEYFSNGEKLITKQHKREGKIELNESEIIPNFEGFESNLDNLNWEFQTNFKKSKLPSTFLNFSEYINNLIRKDTIHSNEPTFHKRPNNTLIIDPIIVGLNYNQITEITENTFSRYFNRIYYSIIAETSLKEKITEWLAQTEYLESLDKNEIVIYNSLLNDLKTHYKNGKNEMNSIMQPLKVAYETLHDRVQYEDKKKYRMPDNAGYGDSYQFCDNRELNLVASEKLERTIFKLDKDSGEKLCYFLSIYRNNTDTYKEISINCDTIVHKMYSSINPTRLDSLYFYDYYFLKFTNYKTYRAIFPYAYITYLANNKYKIADFERIYNLLKINNFTDKTPNFRENKREKIELLKYTRDYERAISDIDLVRKSLKEHLLILWSPFSLLYCFLGALVFYTFTLSSALQFSVAFFIISVYWGVILFLCDFFKIYQKFNYTYNNGSHFSVPFFLVFIQIHCAIFALFIVKLFISKKQWNNAHILVNSLLISGLGSVFAAIYYVIEKRQHEESFTFAINRVSKAFEIIKMVSPILIVSILIYTITVWLFKRHLTYPKKK
jgi:hypothetical protein